MNLVCNSTKRRGYYPPFTNGPIALFKPTGLSEEAVSGLTALRKPCLLDPLQAFVLFKGNVDPRSSVKRPDSEAFHSCSSFLGSEALVGSGGGGVITGTGGILLSMFADCSLLVLSVIQKSFEPND